MAAPVNIVKGTRLLVRRFVAKPLGTWSLAGAQMKLAGTMEEFEGVVTHIYGDHPTEPKNIEFTVRKDDGSETTVKAEQVKAVIATD